MRFLISNFLAGLILGWAIADDYGRSVEEYVHMFALNKLWKFASANAGRRIPSPISGSMGRSTPSSPRLRSGPLPGYCQVRIARMEGTLFTSPPSSSAPSPSST